jgi:LuxR family transcriptional regulator, maltose regulon positive regulatory protein
MLAKLDVPQPPSRMLLRPRLVDRVAAGVAGRLTIVCAPAGSGKTTLMLSWLSSSRAPGPVVWISLDGCDRQPAVFWSYLLTGLVRAGVSGTGVEWPTDPSCVSRSFLVHLAAELYQRS